jgi:cyclohexyl-isocyanide hydratase
VRYLRDGNLFTASGVTAGIDFALTMVAELAGSQVARAIQLQIEYAPAPPFDAGTPESAPSDIVRAARARGAAMRKEREAIVARVTTPPPS